MAIRGGGFSRVGVEGELGKVKERVFSFKVNDSIEFDQNMTLPIIYRVSKNS